MQKIFNVWYLTILMVVCVGFSSCSKEDYGDIVGRWQLEAVTPVSELEPCEFDGWIEFNNDGTWSEFNACDDEIVHGTWQRDGKELTITSSPPVSISMVFTIVSVSDDKLVLSIMGAKATYKRL